MSNNYNNQGNQGVYANFAEISIIGNLGKDFESKIVGNSKVAQSSVAVNQKNKDKADWWTIEVWGNEGRDALHNLVVNNGSKGRKVFVKGRPIINEGSQGGVFPTIRVTTVEFLDKKESGGQNQQSYQPPQNQIYQPPVNQGYQAPPAPPNQGGVPPMPPQQGGYPQNPGQPAPPVPPQQGYAVPPMPPKGVPPQTPNGYPQG